MVPYFFSRFFYFKLLFLQFPSSFHLFTFFLFFFQILEGGRPEGALRRESWKKEGVIGQLPTPPSRLRHCMYSIYLGTDGQSGLRCMRCARVHVRRGVSGINQEPPWYNKEKVSIYFVIGPYKNCLPFSIASPKISWKSYFKIRNLHFSNIFLSFPLKIWGEEVGLTCPQYPPCTLKICKTCLMQNILL